jgi:hypothetical protein
MSTDAPMPSSAGRVYQLTDGTVSPTRVAGRTKYGIPIEETIPQILSVKFVDLNGNVCDVAIRCSRVDDRSDVSQKYEDTMRKDQLKAGCLPLDECPLTQEYRRITGTDTLLGNYGPDLPEGSKACDGKPGGCEHLLPVIAERRRLCRERHDQEMALGKTIPVDVATDMVRALGEGLKGMPTGTAAMKDARANLRDGKGEK